MKKTITPKEVLSILAVIAAIGFGIAGTLIAPQGIIDSSMLYLIAQLLIFAATLMGFGEVITKLSDTIGAIKSNRKQHHHHAAEEE